MKLKVLIVDDVESARKAMRIFLTPRASALDMMNQLIAGGENLVPALDIEEASQGSQAVAMAKAAHDAGKPYDFMFVDALMPPGIDGVEALRQIREFDPDIPFVICTALLPSVTAEIARQTLGHEPTILQKPLTPETKLVELMLAKRRKPAACDA